MRWLQVKERLKKSKQDKAAVKAADAKRGWRQGCQECARSSCSWSQGRHQALGADVPADLEHSFALTTSKLGLCGVGKADKGSCAASIKGQVQRCL